MPTVFITGANRGLGLAFTKQFLADGWEVIAACRNRSDADGLAALCPGVEARQLDLSDNEQIALLAGALKGRSIDLLINNAAWHGYEGGFHEIAYASWEQSMQVNVFAVIKLTGALLHNLLLSEKRTVIYISSLMGSLAENTKGKMYSYRCSKAAGNMAVRNLAAELKPQSVTVAAINPGWVKTRLGGSKAPVPPETSAASIKSLIDRLSIAETGRFFNYTGEEIKW